jgi:hypothetical protein
MQIEKSAPRLIKVVLTNVTGTEPVIEPINPKNRNRTGTGKKTEKKPDPKTSH